jgi:hypothetical protein
MALTRWSATVFMVAFWLLAIPLARSQPAESALELPEAPSQSVQQSASSNSSTQATAQSPAQTSPVQNTTPDEQRKKTEEQLKAEEHQRVFGVMAAFNTTRNKDALPLSTGEKFRLFFKSATDPWPFVLSAAGAGIDQADDSFPQWGQGMQGYAKRFGGAYSDYFIGNFFGNAVLTTLFREDPRFFQMSTGPWGKRALWAAGSSVWCKRDNGSWGPNYANVVGNLMGAAVSNLYYPDEDRTAGDTISRGFTVTAQGIIGAEVIEFWPDLVRRHRRKQAEKLARQAAKNNSQNATTPSDKK